MPESLSKASKAAVVLESVREGQEDLKARCSTSTSKARKTCSAKIERDVGSGRISSGR